MEPLKALINNSGKPGKSWTDAMAGCLEAAIVDGAPNLVKLEEIDEAVDRRCQWCFQAEGSSLHRVWDCDGSRNFRDAYGHCPEVLGQQPRRMTPANRRSCLHGLCFQTCGEGPLRLAGHKCSIGLCGRRMGTSLARSGLMDRLCGLLTRCCAGLDGQWCKLREMEQPLALSMATCPLLFRTLVQQSCGRSS